MAERTLKQKTYRGAVVLLLIFVALFAFRFIYTYTNPGSDAADDYIGSFSDEFQNSRKNYASDSYKYSKQSEVTTTAAADKAPPAPTISVEQKYEKVATLNSKTDKFDESEKQSAKPSKVLMLLFSSKKTRAIRADVFCTCLLVSRRQLSIRL